MIYKTELYEHFEDILRSGSVQWTETKDHNEFQAQQEFELYREIRSLLTGLLSAKRNQTAFMAHINKFNNEFFILNSSSSKISFFKLHFNKIAALFICLIVFFSGIKWYADSHYSNNAISNMWEIKEYAVSRSIPNIDNSNQIFQLFEAKDYEKVISLIQKKSLPLEANDILMLGASYFYINRIDEALKTYEMLNVFDGIYSHDYYYNKILCFLKKGEIEKAKQVCENALADKNITNTYTFIKINEVLNHPLRKLTN
ncbi:MAG: hypothetical protein IPO92_08345 [Saprospiraceae bacterium]|nr:hypothetical protein [Saprospiraceae bacterium]